MKQKIFSKLSELFGMDVRTLALFRVGLALLVLFDLIFRSRYIRAHYTSFGMKAPGQLDHKFAEWGLSWIPHTIDSFPFQVGFFLVFGLVALCLLFGLHTRLASAAIWLLLLALHTQNTNIMQGGDLFLRMLLFWGMFLPLGACFSIDSALNSSPEKIPDRIVSAGTLGLLLQVCFVYWFTAAFKASPIWWEEGTAIYYALNIDQFATPLGHFLLGFPELLRVMSFATIWWEVVGPILAFIPFFTGPIRTATVFLFIGFHLGLGFSLELGPFPYICSVAWTAFLPSWFWDKIFHWLRTPARLGLKIYYDGDCGFCKKTVLLIRTFFLLPETPLLPAQGDPSILADLKAQNSWVLVDETGKRHFKFEAFLYLCRLSPLLWPLSLLLAWRPLAFVGEKIYEQVAIKRQLGSRIIAWLKFKPLHFDTNPWTNALAAFFIIYVFLWNVRSLNPTQYKTFFPEDLNGPGELLGLGQVWNMFSPHPPFEDGWYVMPGILKDGTEVDLFKGGAAVNWKKPKRVSATYDGERWRKFLMILPLDAMAYARPYYADYLCRWWNESHQGSKKLDSLEIDFMEEDTLPDYQTPKLEKKILWGQHCVDPRSQALPGNALP